MTPTFANSTSQAVSKQQRQQLQGLCHTKSRGGLQLMGCLLLSSHHLSLQTKRPWARRNYCLHQTVQGQQLGHSVPLVGYWFLGCGTSWEDTQGRNWYVRFMKMWTTFNVLRLQRSRSPESNICSACPFPSQSWATERSLVKEEWIQLLGSCMLRRQHGLVTQACKSIIPLKHPQSQPSPCALQDRQHQHKQKLSLSHQKHRLLLYQQ